MEGPTTVKDDQRQAIKAYQLTTFFPTDKLKFVK